MTIKLYWSGGKSSHTNFGDDLSPLIVSCITGKNVSYADIKHCDMIAIGSILNKVVRTHWKRLLHLRLHPVTVWGSGSLDTRDLRACHFLNILALRGPLTRNIMKAPHDLPLGDPGILIDRFEVKSQKQYRWGIIPHVIDIPLPQVREIINSTPNSTLIDLSDPDILGTIRKIQSCHFILSSSLHGLISADALGIPHIWTRFSDNIIGGDWKFIDYFSSMDREITSPSLITEPNLRMTEHLATLSNNALMKKRKTEMEKSLIDFL